MTTDVYNRHDDNKRYDRHLFRADRVLQSAELNEVQSNVFARLKSVGDVLFREGGIVRGAIIKVDSATGQTLCESGAVYLDGAVRGVPPATITVPTVGVVQVGIYMTRVTVSEMEDPDLLNPAVGTRGYREPGALRERLDTAWGWKSGATSDGQAGSFWPVWTVEDGWVRPKEAPPNLDAVTQALARYDRDSAGGTYVVRGLRVQRLPDLPTGEQVYSLSQGACRVAGRGVELPTTRRVVWAAQPDLRRVDSEPHTSSTENEQRVNVDTPPMVGTPEVRIVARKTVQVTHGGHAGAADPLPDASVLKIEEVKQGGTTYASPADYSLTAGQVDWAAGGAEPAPGSTYEVTYQYLLQATPENVDAKGFTVRGALAGQLITVTYNHALRRIDRLCLSSEGNIAWIKGIPAIWQPLAPEVPDAMLALASVHQFWDGQDGQTRVAQDGVRVVPMDVLSAYGEQLARLREDQAEIRLAVDIAGRHSGVKKGLFADPLMNSDLRDAGQAQTAAITAGALRLPMEIEVHDVGKTITTTQAPASSDAAEVSQPERTGWMLVNPYQAFDPLPRKVTLNPSIDRWTQVDTQWSDPITQAIQASQYRRAQEEKLLEESTAKLPNLRATRVAFELDFGPRERLQSCTFGGLEVACEADPPGGELRADAQGILRGAFTVPATLPAGTHRVEFRGTGGSFGDADFTGQGELTTRKMQIVRYRRYDPLAQTFTITRERQIRGVNLWFTAKGAKGVLVQLREAENGYPTQRVLAETHVKAANITLGQWTAIHWPATDLQANREYALVILCDDAETALAIAELGKFDATRERWVTAQPYQVGVLLSSSNASTWTAHQDADLTFELLAADYTESTRLIELGEAQVVDASDLLVQAVMTQPTPAAQGVFVLTPEGKEAMRAAPGQVISLPERFSGKVKVQAELKAAQGMAALLEPGVQLVAGSIQPQGTYITPMLGAGGTVRVRVVIEANLPAGSAVTVHAQAEGSSDWAEVPYLQSSPQTAGTLEITYELASFAATRLRLRLTLTGSHKARPEVRNLRAVVL